MKRFFSVLMLIAILLSCCACAKKAEPEASTAPIVQDALKMSPEELYGHIDQTQPVDGVYKIWSIKGVEQLAKTPNATFEVLCHIDLEGATLAPVPEFTGEIIGGNWTIKNFTVADNFYQLLKKVDAISSEVKFGVGSDYGSPEVLFTDIAVSGK